MRIAIPVLLCLTAVVATAEDPGKPSPPFTILRPGAPPIQLSQYRGKIVALTFILTTCPHCQALTGALGPIAREYAPKGVQFVECAFNVGAEGLVPVFVQQFQPPFPVGWSTDAAVRNYLSFSMMDQRGFYVPHMVFLDRNGVIRGDHPGEETAFFTNPEASIRAELDKLLKASAPTTAGTKKK